MVQYGHKIEEKVKDMTGEIKENAQGTNSEGKETWTQINGLDQKKEMINKNRTKKQESRKMRINLGTFRTTLNIPASKS